MPEVAIEFKQASERYPDAVSTIIRKLRRGKKAYGKVGKARLKHMASDPCEMDWAIGWSIGPTRSVTTEEGDDQTDLLARDVDARVKDDLKRIQCPVLIAEIGGWSGKAILGIHRDLPAEITDELHAIHEEAYVSDQRWLNLTPEEKQAEEDKSNDRTREILQIRVRTRAREVFSKAFKECGLLDVGTDAEGSDEFFNELDEAITRCLESVRDTIELPDMKYRL